jgi:hypothetical protein
MNNLLYAGSYFNGGSIFLSNNQLTRFESDVFESVLEKTFILGGIQLANSNIH